MEDRERFQRAIRTITTFVPKFKVRAKANSLLHMFLAWVMFFNKGYMTKFWTTVGFTTSYPDNEKALKDWRTLYHEGYHAIQAQQQTRTLMALKYLFPQVLGIPSLVLTIVLLPALTILSFFGVNLWDWWLLWVFPPLVFLLPWPAYWRTKMELEAYQVTLAIAYWHHGKHTAETTYVGIIRQFIWSNYYFMWPFKRSIELKLRKLLNEVYDMEVFGHAYFRTIYWHMLTSKVMNAHARSFAMHVSKDQYNTRSRS